MSQNFFNSALLNSAAALPADIRACNRVATSRRFAIYRNNVMVTLIDALADCYPVVNALVGEEFFRTMAREFAGHHFPSSPIMAEYGNGFAEFIETFAPAATLPYLSDMARLEWQRVIAWNAADVTTLTAKDLTQLLSTPTKLIQTSWCFHPSLSLVESSFATVSLWLAHQHANSSQIRASLDRLDLLHAESALVMRQNLNVVVLKIQPAQAAFVAALQSGKNLGNAVNDGLTLSEHFDLAEIFGLLVQSGALCDYQVIN
jgi:hypothetical protein